MTGLIRVVEPELSWRTISKAGLGSDQALHLAVDRTSHSELCALTCGPQSQQQAVLAGRDGGGTRAPLGG